MIWEFGIEERLDATSLVPVNRADAEAPTEMPLPNVPEIGAPALTRERASNLAPARLTTNLTNNGAHPFNEIEMHEADMPKSICRRDFIYTHYHVLGVNGNAIGLLIR